MAMSSYLFTEQTGGSFLPPDDVVTGLDLVCLEEGGIAISDSSQGIRGSTWQSSYAPLSGNIILTNTDTSIPYTIITGEMNVESLSFAFDSNMRPSIAWVNSTGVAKHYWYDTVTEDYVTTTLPAGSVSPKLCHDDKRPFAVTGNKSDILLFYVYNDIVWCRIQRERYATDHQCATVQAGTTLGQVGMTRGLRIKLQLVGGGFISSP